MQITAQENFDLRGTSLKRIPYERPALRILPQPMSIPLSKAEKSYIRTGILSNPPSRADGRALTALRLISVHLGVAGLANGSARLSIGRTVTVSPHGGGTEVLAATNLEVETIGPGSEAVDGGRIVCTVTW